MTSSVDQIVHIIDDDASICDALLNLLDAIGIGARCYSSAEQFREEIGTALAGCILLDARLPGISGPEFQDQLRRSGCELPIIFMTAHGDMAMVRKVLKAGAIEFLIKPFQKEELLQAVQQAFAIDAERRSERATLEGIQARINALTDREKQVMAMVTAGLLNKQIAAELGISEIMVKVHRRRVMDGMQAGSLADLVKLCEQVKFASWVGT
ncbi:response regulator transcription factor [Occallatibacter savannae]|uniref:response regulator transcription factor n=1 Tax=Occallatibacter savannae TaxID=1002691 RepID=UPI000D69286D|nr:response regulator [Occallatibacter savannae]